MVEFRGSRVPRYYCKRKINGVVWAPVTLADVYVFVFFLMSMGFSDIHIYICQITYITFTNVSSICSAKNIIELRNWGKDVRRQWRCTWWEVCVVCRAGEDQPTLPPIQVGLHIVFIYIYIFFFAQHIVETSMKDMS